jgi:hypothetical protein
MVDLKEKRGEIIEKFINIESMMNAIISQHYFKKVVRQFYLEVLYDEYFSFGLRRRILEKILTKIDNGKIQHLNRLNTIRNYFAHCNLEMYENKNIEKKIIPDPRNNKKEINFELLYSEFIEKENDVLSYLIDNFEKMGGILSDNKI